MSIRGFRRRLDEATPGRSPASGVQVNLDPSQRSVLALPDEVSAAVIGAPGSGKTSTLVEFIADRIGERGWAPEQLLALTSSRSTASRLRDRIADRIARPTNGPMARTTASLAFEIGSMTAEREGRGPLRLITGAEQDSDFGQLLSGHLDDAAGPRWPKEIGPDVRRLRAFRTELRELFMRTTEFGLSSDGLRELATQVGRPEWAAAADFFDEYLDVVSLLRPGQVDATELERAAAESIRAGSAGERVAALRTVLVDDLQEATESTLSVLRALASRGVSIVAFGDPDVAANSFRGGEPAALGRIASTLELPGARVLYLDTVHRHGAELRAVTSAVVSRIGTAAAGRQRAAHPSERVSPRDLGTFDPVLRIEASTPSREIAAVARVLREHHLIGGVAWNDMAIVARSGLQLPALARALALAEVPTRTAVGGIPLREGLAARSLLDVVDIGAGRSALTVDSASAMLVGPFGGLDTLGLRRLRLAMRAEELAGGGTRQADELLVDAIAAPGRLVTIDHRIGRSAARLASILSDVAAAASSGATIEELLWLVWERAGHQDAWREAALGVGQAAAEAGRDLDGVLAVFTAAKRFVEREPSSPPGVFLAAVLDAEVPEDTLSPQPVEDAALVATPSSVVGSEYAIVAVMRVQDGLWPDPRIRGSLLGAGRLVEVIRGIPATPAADARREVVSDEARLFALAVSRASRQVIVSSVSDEDESPSVFCSLLPPSVPAIDVSTLPPMSLRGLTGRLRRELVAGRAGQAELAGAASSLALLAENGVPGADPSSWHGLADPSSSEPLFLEGERVPVSPSQLSAIEESPLDWFIGVISGSTASPAMGIGTIVHWAMETATDASVDTLFSAVESRWGELSFEAPWVGAHQMTQARRLVEGVAEYLADFSRSGSALVGAESRFELDVGLARMRGSIDRVERSADGSVVIVDLKTGRPEVSAEVVRAHPQLLAYQLAYAEGSLDDLLAPFGSHVGGGAKLLFVKAGVRGKSYREAVQQPATAEELEGFRRRIDQAATVMAAAQFVGTVEVSGWSRSLSSGARLHRVPAVSSD